MPRQPYSAAVKSDGEERLHPLSPEGKGCANERNESPLSHCRVQPTFSMRKKGLEKAVEPSLRFKGGLVGFRRTLIILWLLRRKPLYLHRIKKTGGIMETLNKEFWEKRDAAMKRFMASKERKRKRMAELEQMLRQDYLARTGEDPKFVNVW